VFQGYIAENFRVKQGPQHGKGGWLTIAAFFKRILQAVGQDIIQRSRISQLLNGPDTPGEVIELVSEFVSLFNHRQFLVTKDGRMGVARTCDMRPRDEVRMAFGCLAPLILRRREHSGYIIVSQN
jgi:hypothetical protein